MTRSLRFPDHLIRDIEAAMDKAIELLGDRKTAIAVGRTMLPEIRDQCQPFLDAVLLDWMNPKIRKRLGGFNSKKKSRAAAQPNIPGLEGIDLPVHLAIPPLSADDNIYDDDAGESDTIWVRTDKATIGEVRRNVALRDRLIDGAQEERDKIYRLLSIALSMGGRDDEVAVEVINKEATVPA